MTHPVAGLGGLALILIVLWDAFETIILPRRVTRKFRLARLFYLSSWRAWAALVRHLPDGRRRDSLLSYYGPLSLLLLLILWAIVLIIGFGVLQWGAGSALVTASGSPGLVTDFYLSGTTFFTLGLGDVTPRTELARWITVIEAGTGFAFLALMIGYLPVIYQSFSRREVSISMLDARAGSPPTAGELLRRHANDHGLEALRVLLYEWERWSAELLESLLSYPVLAYFRSQHNNQSWLAAVTTILDTCALVIADLEGACARQAELTFAMARHTVVDLAQIFSKPPVPGGPERLPPEELARLRAYLLAAGLKLRQSDAADERLRELRFLYEPYVEALSQRLLFPLAPWLDASSKKDNWQTSGWDRFLRTQSPKTHRRSKEDHF